MKTLLVINSSGRVARSVTRRATAHLAHRVSAGLGAVRVVERDVGVRAPSPVNESWIAAAFADVRTTAADEVLEESEALVEEVDHADAIILGAPIYNFGLPAQLKAYFDQIIRIGRTFEFHPDAPEPYEPLLIGKPCVVCLSVSERQFHPGGTLDHLNFAEPHLRVLWGFIGITDLTFVHLDDGPGDWEIAAAGIEAVADALSIKLTYTAAATP
ncbi:MAG: FMN-dependent NADH-azoreductase [Actinomycetota bacterium]